MQEVLQATQTILRLLGSCIGLVKKENNVGVCQNDWIDVTTRYAPPSDTSHGLCWTNATSPMAASKNGTILRQQQCQFPQSHRCEYNGDCMNKHKPNAQAVSDPHNILECRRHWQRRSWLHRSTNPQNKRRQTQGGTKKTMAVAYTLQTE
jgi:hypothetical protein